MSRALGWVSGVVCSCFLVTVAGATTYRQIARTGQDAVGTTAAGGGVLVYQSFLWPVINDAGDVAFVATTNDLSGSGIWAESTVHGGLALVAQQGMAAPDLLPGGIATGQPVGAFTGFGLDTAAPNINADGQVLFWHTLSGAGVIGSANNEGIWLYSPGSGALELQAREGGQMPGEALGVHLRNFRGSQTPGFNDAGQALIMAYLTGGGVDGKAGQWIFDAGIGTYVRVAGVGDPFPQPPGSGVYESLTETPRLLNNAGQTLIGTTRGSGTGIVVADASGVVWWETASPSSASGGSGGPGSITATIPSVFSFIRPEAMNGHGDVAFIGSPGDLLWEQGLYTTTHGPAGFAPVFVRNQSVPGVAGATFRNASGLMPEVNHVAMNDNGRTAMLAGMYYPGIPANAYRGIWIDDASGGLELVVHEGMVAPGFAVGTSIGDNSFGTLQVRAALNNDDVVAFKAKLAGPGFNAGQDDVLYLWNVGGSGGLTPIVYSGMTFDVDGNGLMKTVRTIEFQHEFQSVRNDGMVSTADGRRSGLSDDNLVAFRVVFTDGTEAVYTGGLPTPIVPLGVCDPVTARLDPNCWTTVGNVGMRVDPGDGSNMLLGMVTASPVSLAQTVMTPNEAFFLTFEYQFLQEDGFLTVMLGDIVIDYLPAPQLADGLTQRRINIHDANLFGGEFELKFEFNATSAGQTLLLDNIGVPEPGVGAIGSLLALAGLRWRRAG